MVRRLTAIMFTDMVGFTALVQEDERRARTDRDRQRGVLDTAIASHGGELLEVHGDGTLSTFPSAVQAVRAAMEIQRQLNREPRIPLRIGIHSGDVVHDEDGVFGDGVNVAARIQSLSVPGGVLISGKVWDEVKNQPDIRTRSLGEFNLKNVQRAMEVHGVLGEGLSLPDDGTLAENRARCCRSVAVLPFVNMSSDPENEFFSDGVSEEIINALTRVNGLQVTARTSSFKYKNRNEDVRQIAQELGASVVLEGSVRRAGNRVRITAQLIDSRDGYHVFSEVYDRGLDDIFETQDEIARTIVAELETHLAPGGTSEAGSKPLLLVRAHTHDSDAYTAYLKGLARFREWTPEGARSALEHYERSVEMDPACALPLSGMATAYTFLAAIGHMEPDVAFPRAKAAALRALELEEAAGESHLALAVVKFFWEWDFDAAYVGFQKALSLTPGSAEVHHLYAMYLTSMGELEAAAEELETAQQLDPLSPTLYDTLAEVYMKSGRIEDAFAQVRRALELDPDFRTASETLGWLHVLVGQYEEALAAFKGIVDRTGDPFKVIPHRAYALARLGRHEEAERMRDLLEQRRRAQPQVSLEVDFAILHAGLGEADKAFEYLEKAVEKRLAAAIFMSVEPLWGDLRDDPRFDAMLRKVGLSPAAAA